MFKLGTFIKVVFLSQTLVTTRVTFGETFGVLARRCYKLCIGTCHNILAWDQNWLANVASIFKPSHLDEVFDDMFVSDLYKSIGDFCACAKPFV
jgi:hypothetical protein